MKRKLIILQSYASVSLTVEVILPHLDLKNGVQLSSLIAAFRFAHSFSSYKGLFTSIVNTVDRKYGSAGKNSKHSV